jgi:hypothetical protein
MLKREGSDEIATSLKEDESPPQYMHSPVARSAIISPADSSPSPVTMTPIAANFPKAITPTATGPLAKLICIMSEGIEWLSSIDPTDRNAVKKSSNILLMNWQM